MLTPRRQTDTDTLAAALAYAAEGLPVFPVFGFTGAACSCGDAACTDQGKHPATPRGLTDATTDPEQIKAWWHVAPKGSLNVGIAVPDGYLVVDVDPKHQGYEQLAALEAANGQLPPTRTAGTGSGGEHAWYRMPPGWALPGKLQLDGAPQRGLDTRQLGGYVVAPPSMHASGRRYKWAGDGSVPWKDQAIAVAPDWLIAQGGPRGERAVATELTELDDPIGTPEQHAEIVAAVVPGMVDGQKHTTIKAFGGWMRQRGWTSGDVEAVARAVLEHTPNVRDVDAGVRAALYAFRVDRAYGYRELAGLVGPSATAELERTHSPKWTAEREHRASASRLMADLVARRLERSAPPLTAAASAAPSDDPLMGLGIALGTEIQPIHCVVKGLEIAPGKVSGIVGYANSGKSPFAAQLALCVANGAPFLGFETEQRRVGFLAYESAALTQLRLSRLAVGLGLNRDGVDVVRMSRYLSEPDVLPLLVQVIERSGWGLVVVDTYGSAVTGIDHNSSQFSDVAKQLEHVSEATGVPIVVLFHARKDASDDLQQIAGHNSIAGAIQVAVGLSRPDPTDVHTIRVHCLRELQNRFPDFLVKAEDVAGETPGETVAAGGVGLRFVRVEPKADEKRAAPAPRNAGERVDLIREKLRAYAAGPMRQNPTQAVDQRTLIAVAHPARRTDVIAALRAMGEDGELVRKVSGRAGCPVTWSLPDNVTHNVVSLTPALGTTGPPGVEFGGAPVPRAPPSIPRRLPSPDSV